MQEQLLSKDDFIKNAYTEKYGEKHYEKSALLNTYKEVTHKAMNGYAKQQSLRVRKLLKEARDMLVVASLLDKSGHCMQMVNKIEKAFPNFNK